MGKKIKIWAAQTRADFLVLSIVLVLIGWALAWGQLKSAGMEFPWLDAGLLMFGVILAHASVNLFNEHSDFVTGIDFDTLRTPFSGGSGMLVQGKTKAVSVMLAAVASLLLSGAIGLYLALQSNLALLYFILIGAFSITFYTGFLAKIMLGEILSGLTLGSMVVVGSYIALTATAGSTLQEMFPAHVVWISIPPGILTALLLFINEFPDADADKKGGRKHLVIGLGKKRAALVYAISLALVYAIIIVLPFLALASYWIYLSLLTLPFALKAMITLLKDYQDFEKIIPAQGSHVVTTLSLDFLLAVAIFIEIF